MAFDLSKLNFFNRLDARARVFVLFAGLIGLLVVVYLGTRWLSGGNKAIGPSQVASTPAGLTSVHGGQLSPEYYRALMQANVQSAQQAQISGGSAVNTLVNTGQPTGTANCIVCSDQSANVKSYLDDWVRQGNISPDLAQSLQQLADKNVPVDEYATELNRLVKEGKLTPEQARMLLEQYKKQHQNALLNDSAKLMDDMIKAGGLPIGTANQLLDLQKKGLNATQYAKVLQELVHDGKLSPEAAQRLLAQYTQQRAKEIIQQSIAILQQMAREGQMTPDVLKELLPLEEKMVPLDTMTQTLQTLVQAGKLTPAVAGKIQAEYKQQKADIGTTSSIDELIKQAENAAFAEISELLQTGKITPEVAAQLTDMIQKNVSLDNFKAAIAQMVQQRKLTPEIAQLKIGDYTKVKQLRDMQERLANLQANNATPFEYAEALKKAVEDGAISPEQAAQLMQDYQAATASSDAVAATPAGTEAFAALQKRVQAGNVNLQPVVTGGEFSEVQAQAAQESAQDKQARIDALTSAMSSQAQQLVTAWQPQPMEHKEGIRETIGSTKEGSTSSSKSGSNSSVTSSASALSVAPLIKAGTIIFAVLDTAVNSDYPDSPVMATVVAGKYKGAKLLGKLMTTKGVSGQMDRVSLNFSLMNLDEWPKSKTVTAFAIDPDTARTVLASDVDYHYMKRFGAIMATSFLQGYANAITTSGSNTTTGIFGTSNTYPQLSPGNKLAVGLGQVGQTLGKVTENYTNIPPTVRVDSGVGLGILFMADVT